MQLLWFTTKNGNFIYKFTTSVTELRSVTEGRSGPPWGVPGRVRHRRPAGSLVPARVERARSFSGSQHGRCGHGRSLVPSTGGAWPGGEVLRCSRREVLSLVFSQWRCWGNQIVKQKLGGGGDGGVEARDFTVSEGHEHPLVYNLID